MAFRTPRLVKRTRSGVELQLGRDERRLMAGLVAEMRVLLDTDDPSLRRLFPTAYLDDPAKDAEYQILARAELADRRVAALDAVAASVEATTLDAEQVIAWMQAVNQIRLVLGTRLEVSEEEDEFDPDATDAPARAVYAYLGLLLEQLVDVAR